MNMSRVLSFFKSLEKNSSKKGLFVDGSQALTLTILGPGWVLGAELSRKEDGACAFRGWSSSPICSSKVFCYIGVALAP